MAAGAEDGGLGGLLDAPLAEGGDQSGHVGVVPVPAAVGAADHRVDRLHRAGDRRDRRAERERRPLQRHGQRQPGPLGAEPGDEAGELVLVGLVPVVRPAVEAQFGVGGAVQGRGERVADGLAEDGGPAAPSLTGPCGGFH